MRKALLVTIMALILAGGTAVTVFAQYKDGVFTAQDKPDRLKYVGHIKLTVKEGKIVAVEYDEVKGKDSKRKSNYVNTEMKKRNGLSWDEMAAKLEGALLSGQDPDMIDMITGATDTHGRFIALAKAALKK